MVIYLRKHTLIKDDLLSLHTYSKVSHLKYRVLINLELYCYSSAVSVHIWYLTDPGNRTLPMAVTRYIMLISKLAFFLKSAQ